MYKKIISAFQLLNILFQALYSLALPIGIGALAAFLLTKFASIEKWIWAPFLIAGVFTGLYSLVKFLLTATKNLERLEKERDLRESEERERKNKQEKLKAENNEIE